MSELDLGVIGYGQAPILRQPPTSSQPSQEAQACVDEPQKRPVSLESVSPLNNTATIVSTPLIEHRPSDGLFARTSTKGQNVQPVKLHSMTSKNYSTFRAPNCIVPESELPIILLLLAPVMKNSKA